MGTNVAVALYEYVDLVLMSDRNRYEKVTAKKKDKHSSKKGHPKSSSKKSPSKAM